MGLLCLFFSFFLSVFLVYTFDVTLQSYFMSPECNAAIHKKCIDSVIYRCTGTAANSRDTMVSVSTDTKESEMSIADLAQMVCLKMAFSFHVASKAVWLSFWIYIYLVFTLNTLQILSEKFEVLIYMHLELVNFKIWIYGYIYIYAQYISISYGIRKYARWFIWIFFFLESSLFFLFF